MLHQGNSKTYWDPSRILSIAPNDLEIWMVPVTIFPELYPRFSSLLSADEQTRADRFLQPNDFKTYLIGKITTRLLLGQYLGIAPQRIRFEKGKFSKPFLCGSPSLQFNISHSQQWVAVAICKSEIGIDIEKMSPLDDISAFVEIFTQEELAYIMENPVLKIRRFYYLWTRKESFFKQKGTGMGSSINPFSVIGNGPDLKQLRLRLTSYCIEEYLLSACYPLHISRVQIHDFHLSVY